MLRMKAETTLTEFSSSGAGGEPIKRSPSPWSKDQAKQGMRMYWRILARRSWVRPPPSPPWGSGSRHSRMNSKKAARFHSTVNFWDTSVSRKSLRNWKSVRNLPQRARRQSNSREMWVSWWWLKKSSRILTMSLGSFQWV